MDWDRYAVCTGCDRKHRAPFGKVFFLSFQVCPSCGEPKDYWPIRTLRWVSTGFIHKPSTWGSGHWEERGKHGTNAPAKHNGTNPTLPPVSEGGEG